MFAIARFILCVPLLAAVAWAQPADKGEPTPSALREAWLKAAGESRWAEAAEALERYIAAEPDDLIARYNLIIVQLGAGARDEAEAALKDAVEWGWSDLRRLERDPALRPLRDTRTYRAVIDNWRTVQDGILAGRIKRYQQEYGPSYRVLKDESLRVAIVSPLAQLSLDDAMGEMRRVTRYWSEHILPAGTPPVIAEGDRPDPWIIILLPADADYKRWANKTYGERGDQIAGIYEHDKLRLISKDIGATLRHEYSHLLHWRHMERLGQTHPMWIQEGLCTLLEDVRVLPGKGDAPAQITPTASWRTNMARRMLQSGGLPKWSALTTLKDGSFNERRALGNYAAARSVFFFLAEKGKLRAWYDDYTRSFADDATGAQSISRAMDTPLEQVEKDWRTWLRTLPEVAEAGRGVRVGLPFAVEATPDGLKIRNQSAALESPMVRAGLRVGDVITAVESQPVRDLQELTRILGERKPGDEVELTYRRAGASFTTRVRLGGG